MTTLKVTVLLLAVTIVLLVGVIRRQARAINDHRAYIEAGCHGRFQGAE